MPADRGAAATEVVLVMPILLLVLLGMVQLTYLFRGRLQLELACFRAARAAIVRADQGDWEERALAAAKRSIRTYPLRSLVELKAAEVQAQVGAVATIELQLRYPLRIPMGQAIFGKFGVVPYFPLATSCSLSNEAGAYAAN